VLKFFVVRFISGARQRDCLPCVFIGRTTKKKRTANKLFAVRQEETHGKDHVCRAFYFLVHDKHFSPTGRYEPLTSKWR
jgi:hypothetical protein